MIKVKYLHPELKDVMESIVERSFYIFVQDISAETIRLLDMPARLMNDITINVYPHDKWWMGKAIVKVKVKLESRNKGTIAIKIQDTKSEVELTIRHEIIHLLKPDWSEKKVETTAQEMYQKGEPKEISI